MTYQTRCLGCMEPKGPEPRCPNCGWLEGSVATSALHLAPGTILNDKYLLGKVLGQGGFGITYLAWDLNLNLKLAIKEYFPQEMAARATGQTRVSVHSGTMSNQYQYGMDKFLDEARMLARFEDHPNIVSVRDYFQANETAYLVMNYIEGVTLKEYLFSVGNKMPADKAFGIMMPVMDALKELHTVDVLHRDISPDNIYINKKGQVVLIDFGSARQAISEQGRMLSVIIKPGYAPEEQYRSKGVQGPWTDIYSIASTIYHMITGLLPPESLDRLVEDILVPPSRLGLAIKPEQEWALLKALSVQAKDRFQSIGEFQDVILGKAANGYQPIQQVKIDTPVQAPSAESVSVKPQAELVEQTSVQEQSMLVKEKEKIGKTATLLPLKGNTLYAAIGGLFVLAVVIIVLAFSPGDSLQPTFTCPGGVYEGELKGDKWHGQGSYTCPDGSSYTGQWQNNLMHGQGRRVYADGAIYEGDFRDGLRHGWGVYIWSTGEKYVGEFYQGDLSGKGTYTWPSEVSYIGEFDNNSFNGHGLLTVHSGRTINGSFINGIIQD